MTKLRIYEELPEAFNQLTQYAVQREPVDMEDHIFYGIEIKDIEVEDNEEG